MTKGNIPVDINPENLKCKHWKEKAVFDRNNASYPTAYLSRLDSGWEDAPWLLLLLLPPLPALPEPPAVCRFPDKSFSTTARFPVRAASTSSCSFPIANPWKKKNHRRLWGEKGEEIEKGRGVGWL